MRHPRPIAALTVWCVSAVALGVIILTAATTSFTVERELWIARSTGYAGAIFLAVSIAATPALRMAALFPSSARSLTSLGAALRRAFGLGAAGFAALHFCSVWFTPLTGDAELLIYEPHLRAGLVPLIGLLLLALTSFSAVSRLLRISLWKPLHRLSYVAALFVGQHMLLSPTSPPWFVAGFGGAILLFLGLRLVPGPAEAP